MLELFVAPLSFLEFENKNIHEVDLKPIFEYNLTNLNGNFSKFYDANFIKNFGLIDIDVINRSKVKIYIIENNLFQITEKKINDRLHNIYGVGQIFSLASWFVKDNSINTDFSIYFNQETRNSSIVRKNVMYSNSKGVYENIIFAESELQRALYYTQILLDVMDGEEKDLDKSKPYNNLNNNLNHNTDSFNRALRYLQVARGESFIPSKIASYISTLETLFAVSDSNTYKTPERTSLFIGGNPEDKRYIFDLTKDSYDVRSSYVHGSDIYKKHNKKLEKISVELDVIVRKVVLKFTLNHPELNYTGDNSSKINKYFIDLALS